SRPLARDPGLRRPSHAHASPRVDAHALARRVALHRRRHHVDERSRATDGGAVARDGLDRLRDRHRTRHRRESTAASRAEGHASRGDARPPRPRPRGCDRHRNRDLPQPCGASGRQW
ncbi:MAG: hypothetical protein ACK56F_19980, partial [bacterium]